STIRRLVGGNGSVSPSGGANGVLEVRDYWNRWIAIPFSGWPGSPRIRRIVRNCGMYSELAQIYSRNGERRNYRPTRAPEKSSSGGKARMTGGQD
ncbi:MAG: hypothetical protein DMG13_27480, partial [Acidobacteria bacterium]